MASNEMFYLDRDGKKADALIHEDLLAEGSAPRAVDVAREIGLSDAEIDSLFPTIIDAFNPSQRRDKDGKWTKDDSLRDYLKMVAQHRAESGGAHNRLSVEQFVLDHGRQYRFDDSSFEGPRDEPKMCYMNAGRIAMNNPDRTYVEGFITFHGLPIQHAWTVDKAGKVHDTTLRDGKDTGGYFGVPFSTEYVMETAMKTKVWGIISHTNPSLFKEKNPKTFLADYNPEEKRDFHGRWTSGGDNHHYSKTPAQDLLGLHHSGTETIDDVMKMLTPGQRYAADAAEVSLRGLTPTNKEFVGADGKYLPEREKLHAEILGNMFSPEDIAHAIPKKGEQPILTITGGRPASGKTSTLKNELAGVDKHSFYISADTIQEYLPGYNGKQAGLFNGEAQDIALKAEQIARKHGLNITYDATLKSQQPAIDRVRLYQASGYKVNGYFVHTSPLTSAVRTAARFMDSGRYVPAHVSFNSITNEKTFDALIPMLDKWAIYDNNGDKPKLIAHGRKHVSHDGFDPNEPRDKDGKWTSSYDHDKPVPKSWKDWSGNDRHYNDNPASWKTPSEANEGMYGRNGVMLAGYNGSNVPAKTIVEKAVEFDRVLSDMKSRHPGMADSLSPGIKPGRNLFQLSGGIELMKGRNFGEEGKTLGSYNKSSREIKMASSLARGDGTLKPRDWTVTSKSLGGTFRHELGHAVMNEYDIAVRDFNQVKPGEIKRGYPTSSSSFQVTRRLGETVKAGGKGDPFVSMYARTNSHEHFAESFAAYTHPDYHLGKVKIDPELERGFDFVFKGIKHD